MIKYANYQSQKTRSSKNFQMYSKGSALYQVDLPHQTEGQLQTSTTSTKISTHSHAACVQTRVRLTKEGIITEVHEHTEWINSIVPVMKPDGSLRLCLD